MPEKSVRLDVVRDRRDTQHRRGTGAAHVYQRLREEILCLTLPPGEPLDEVGLATRFGLSRSPVREALIRLAADGLVVMLQNRATIVTPFDLEGLPRYLEALDLMQRVTARLAAEHRTDEELERMDEAADVFNAAVLRGDLMQMVERNRDLHVTIARAGHNPHFLGLYSRLLDEGMRMLNLNLRFRTQIEKADPEVYRRDHAQIIEAIRARDPERADRLAHEHTELFIDRFVRYLVRTSIGGVDLSSLLKPLSLRGDPGREPA